jgi:hypothetical protein
LNGGVRFFLTTKKFKVQQFQVDRGIGIIKKTIDDLELNLCKKIILTELGSNDFCFTPIIPLLASAEKVFAIVKDSKYGKAQDIKNDFIDSFGYLSGFDKIEIFCNHIPNFLIAQADIITNSYPLRPLGEKILSITKKGVVIPLMYESWELRDGEIDMDYCKQNNIKVGGTWENHPLIKVFDYVSMLGLKLSFNAGYEVSGNNIFVWSDDHFGERISSGFNNNGGCVFHGINVDLFYEVLPSLDFIFLCDYDETKSYFDGVNPVFSIEKIKKINSKLGIVHLYGTINSELLLNEGFNVYPRKNGYSKYMTETLSYSGQIPVLKLLTAGFKVGQELTEGKYSTLTQILN